MPYGVPMTLQTFAIPLAGYVLGSRKGVIAALIYILLGIVGLPVFAGFTGGPGMLFGRTGGFILAFPFMALAGGIGAKKKNLLWLVLWLIVGALILYTSGMLMFSFVTSNSLLASFYFVVAPFIPTEIIKIIMMILFGKLVKQALESSGINLI
jgi:biotin transport system substrate-specific component